MYGILRCFEDPITEKGFRKILFGLEGYPPTHTHTPQLRTWNHLTLTYYSSMSVKCPKY